MNQFDVRNLAALGAPARLHDALARDLDAQERALGVFAREVQDQLRATEAEFERDSSDRGERNMVSSEVAQPDAATKAEAWDRIQGEGYGSLYKDLAAMRGFNWRTQRDLLEPYVGKFFDSLVPVFAEKGHEYADRYFGVFFPGYRVDDEVVGLISAMLDEIDGPPMLVRHLREAADQLDRALKCRAASDS